MNKLFKVLAFAFTVAVIVGATSCSKENIDDTVINPTTSGTVLYASTPSEGSTRMGFTDNEDYTISLKWKVGDIFTIYNSEGERVGDFTCTDASIGAFTNSEVTLTNAAIYTAIYPASTEATLDDAKSKASDLTSAQDGDKIDNLDNSCYMLADFTYEDDSEPTIKFNHQMAIMTFIFKSTDRPAKLIFENGDVEYTVNYTTIDPTEGVYTSHIMINPCSATPEGRSLIFTLYDSSDKSYDTRTTTSTREYKAGERYRATVSDYTAITNWNDLAAASFSLGDGSAANPYEISSAAELALLSVNIASGTDNTSHYKLIKDIDLSGYEFTPIGDYHKPFQGTFDGGGHTISGLYINQSTEESYSGFFGYTSGATVKSVNVSGEVTSTGLGSYVGGVVANVNMSTSVIYCSFSGSVKGGRSSNIGGVVGLLSSGTVTNCYNSGSAEGDSNSSVGGVVGYFEFGGTVVANCYNSGSVKGDSESKVGGVVGTNEGPVTNCYNSGSISATSSEYIGGVVGSNYNTVTNCYWDDSIYTGDGIGYDENSGDVTGYETDYMRSASFLLLLNDGAAAYNSSNPTLTACGWKAVTDGYPTLDYTNTDPKDSAGDFSSIAAVNALLGTSDTDLRLSNCYIVDPAENSTYKIPVGSRINSFWSDYAYSPDETLEMGSDWTTNETYTIEPLWNDFGLGSYDGQISFSKIAGTDDDYAMQIDFADSFNYSGNMVVAVKKGETIVWSWHIWVTSYNPYDSDASNGTTYDIDGYGTWMDRNIGALGTAYSASNNLYYQWGRKDPITSTATATTAVATIADAVKAPTYFYTNSTIPYDWCGGTTNFDQYRGHHWRDAELASVTDGEYDNIKSIFDPSPLGFMVPGSTSTTSWSSQFLFMWSSSGYANDYSWSTDSAVGTNGFTIPASGYKDNSSGTLTYIGVHGYYWNASPYTNVTSRCLHFYSSTLAIDSKYRSFGYPVRPVKELY